LFVSFDSKSLRDLCNENVKVLLIKIIQNKDQIKPGSHPQQPISPARKDKW
jgi:hypothetical protein